jgi:glyoxylase-like metal-dependent hydrolase (beta-lactamase superfamily II)
VTSIPFVTLDDPQYAQVVQVSPLVRRVVANNRSKYTYLGTGTYIVGRRDVAVIDPGPLLDSHRDALVAALDGLTVRAIVVTHCHSDHSPLAAWLHEATGAPRVAYGPHVVDPGWIDDDDDPEEPDEPDQSAVSDADEPKEALDVAFEPDVRVVDGDLAAAGDGWTLRAVHTPGHTSNHMAFALDQERALFTGDHIMGWSTTVITPPDGDMRAYVESVRKVRSRLDDVLWPTHGGPVRDVAPFVDAYLAHRLEREAQVLAAVRAGVDLVPEMVQRLYVGVDEKLHRAAGRSVLAHLIKLVDDGLVAYEGPQPGVKVRYRPV